MNKKKAETDRWAAVLARMGSWKVLFYLNRSPVSQRLSLLVT